MLEKKIMISKFLLFEIGGVIRLPSHRRLIFIHILYSFVCWVKRRKIKKGEKDRKINKKEGVKVHKQTRSSWKNAKAFAKRKKNLHSMPIGIMIAMVTSFFFLFEKRLRFFNYFQSCATSPPTPKRPNNQTTKRPNDQLFIKRSGF